MGQLNLCPFRSELIVIDVKNFPFLGHYRESFGEIFWGLGLHPLHCVSPHYRAVYPCRDYLIYLSEIWGPL
ncbi:hypothetical protein BN873_p60016 [Candidatus Competibacter denitrificans Run_A_D11]|uniref:Uncharacterized protein n=1 Tax=Candidatus Competibacter denitrificans Run_A_D11 TaxID=1400863 RepID=W6M9R4_9GAMM|nr:hypothetical protein BN873_p60016 [Candidatus Competibacter denitrificans Run_A_D11]